MDQGLYERIEVATSLRELRELRAEVVQTLAHPIGARYLIGERAYELRKAKDSPSRIPSGSHHAGA